MFFFIAKVFDKGAVIIDVQETPLKLTKPL